MSALPPKIDFPPRTRNVRSVPEAVRHFGQQFELVKSHTPMRGSGLLTGATMRMKLFCAAIAAAVTLTPTVSFGQAAPAPGMVFRTGPVGAVWGVFGCAGGIISTAIVANVWNDRQLAPGEAASCGVLYWFTPPPKKAFELPNWSFNVTNKTTIGSATGGASSGKPAPAPLTLINPCRTLFFKQPC
jgi:hypothetical protein